jgi:hypothetical protein
MINQLPLFKKEIKLNLELNTVKIVAKLQD